MLTPISVFDKDGDGSICKEELKAVLENMGETGLTDKELQEMMDEADTNGDGRVDYEGAY